MSGAFLLFIYLLEPQNRYFRELNDVKGKPALLNRLEEIEDELVGNQISFGPIGNRPWNMATDELC